MQTNENQDLTNQPNFANQNLSSNLIKFISNPKFAKFIKFSSQISLFSCLIVIEYLATTSRSVSVNEVFWDKFNHFFAFFVLFILLNLSFKMSNLAKFSLLLVFGLQIEIIQHFLPERYFSLFDIFADFVGILIGFIFVKVINGKVKNSI